MSAQVTYRKEFFDRDYSTREAYARVWKYARKYWFRLAVGIICGMLTAGTMLPLFQIVQPALEKVGGENAARETARALPEASAADAAPPAAATAAAPRKNKFERDIEKHSHLPSWFPMVQKWAGKCGITIRTDGDEIDGALVLIVLVVVPLIALARLVLIFLNNYCLSWSGSRAVADIRVDLLEHVQKQSMQFFGRIDVGQIMTRIISDPLQIQTIMTTILTEVALAPFEIFVAFAFIIYFAIANHMVPTLCLIFIGFPLFVLPIQLIGRRVKKWAKRTLERNSLIGAKVHEILTCIRVVKSYHTEAFENQRYRATNKYLLKSTLRGLRVGLMVTPTVEAVGTVILAGFVVWCFLHHVKLSMVVPMLAPLLIVYKPAKQLSKLQVQIETSLASLSRIFSLQDCHMEIPEKPDAVRLDAFTDRIVFDDVSFRYDTADRDAVSHASFEIRRGQFVAIVGGTGSGKSTASGLLARFYDPREGRITIDGHDLRDVRIGDLRTLIGAVMQETLLFNDTVEENIRYGTPDATHEQVVAAAKLANAHDFIMAQPEGYDRIVGEKGFALSGGERQRIAIARAILRNPPILILDEATSALDTVTERLVQDAINKLMANRTTLAIAHRLSTVRDADLILVMQDGRIVERGTHDELYAANGAYRRLCDMQHVN